MKNLKTMATFSVVAILAVAVFGGFVSANYQEMGRERSGMMKMHAEHHEEVRAAVEAGDYSMLPDEVKEKISEEKFAEMQEMHAKMQEHRDAMEEAVKNNDFEAFKTLHEEHKAQMEDRHEESCSEECSGHPERPELSEEEQQERFNELVAYYNENGKLPEGQHKRNKGNMGKKQYRKGTLNDNQKGIVRRAVKNINNPEKIQKILDRIEEKLETIDASSMNIEKKEKILGMLEGIREIFAEMVTEG